MGTAVSLMIAAGAIMAWAVTTTATRSGKMFGRHAIDRGRSPGRVAPSRATEREQARDG